MIMYIKNHGYEPGIFILCYQLPVMARNDLYIIRACVAGNEVF
jgi:hypothetical protein